MVVQATVKRETQLEELAGVIVNTHSSEQAVRLLEGLLTKREIEEISRRLRIVKLLKDGVPQREIAKRLKVGIATVTRGSKEINKGRFTTV